MMPSQRVASFALALTSTLALLLSGCGDERVPMSVCMSTFERSCPNGDGTSSCVPVTTDPNNCGGCGNRCTSGMLCRASACVPGADGSVPGLDLGPPSACMPSCPSTQRCCGTSCVSRMVASGVDGRSDTSFGNCGGCGTACDAMTASACSGTACTCGTLGRACAAGQICANTGGGFTCQANCGTTGGACAAGTMCCGTGDAAMCLATQMDDANCGSCGNVCGAGTACLAGVCTPLCGGAPCAAAELCCADTCVAAGPANCGSCGVVCAAGEICGAPFFPPGSPVCCGEEGFPGIIAFCSEPFDAGVPDAGPSDAGADTDAGEADAGGIDAGDIDAGDVDGG